MITIPNAQTRQYTQTNRSDLLGTLWSSFNIDLTSNQGKLRVSPRLLLNASTSDLANMTTAPIGFKLANIGGGASVFSIFTVAGSRVFHAPTIPGGTWIQDSGSGTPTVCDISYSDICNFNKNLYVTGNDAKLYELAYGAPTWATPVTTLDALSPHLMESYGNYLYITSAYSYIYSYDTSGTLVKNSGTPNINSYSLDLSGYESNVITFIKRSPTYLLIGTLNLYGGGASLFTWDGVATQPTAEYKIDSKGALACAFLDNTPYVMDADGRLLAFNGGAFVEKARLPIDSTYLFNATVREPNRWIHPNGMIAENGSIVMLVNNKVASDSSIKENLPSGLWQYTPGIGLFHRSSFSYHAVTSGSITDYGQNRISIAGGLASIRDTVQPSTDGSIICGATYFTDASSLSSGIFIDNFLDTKQKYGYIVTTQIESSQIKDTWQKFITFYKRFLSATDKIIVKYRTTYSEPTEASITWTSTTTFTTTTNVLGLEGYEVEGIQGTGSGKTAHITTIDNNAGTYTVTVDEAFTGVTTGTAKVRIQNWIKAGSISDQVSNSYSANIDTTNETIQLKVCCLFTGKNEINKMVLINKANELFG